MNGTFENTDISDKVIVDGKKACQRVYGMYIRPKITRRPSEVDLEGNDLRNVPQIENYPTTVNMESCSSSKATNLFHILTVAPLLLYVGYNSGNVGNEVFTIMSIMGGLALISHTYLLLNKLK